MSSGEAGTGGMSPAAYAAAKRNDFAGNAGAKHSSGEAVLRMPDDGRSSFAVSNFAGWIVPCPSEDRVFG